MTNYPKITYEECWQKTAAIGSSFSLHVRLLSLTFPHLYAMSESLETAME
jgi:hypothetical protein